MATESPKLPKHIQNFFNSFVNAQFFDINYLFRSHLTAAMRLKKIYSNENSSVPLS